MNKKPAKSSTLNTLTEETDLKNFLQNKLNEQYNIANLSNVCDSFQLVGLRNHPSKQNKTKPQKGTR